MLKRILTLLACFVLTAAALSAQTPPPAPKPAGASQAPAATAPVTKPPAPEPVPILSLDARQALMANRTMTAGILRAIAVLQKEVDGLDADFSRQWARMQLPGYTLRGDLTYEKTKAPTPAPVK